MKWFLPFCGVLESPLVGLIKFLQELTFLAISDAAEKVFQILWYCSNRESYTFLPAEQEFMDWGTRSWELITLLV